VGCKLSVGYGAKKSVMISRTITMNPNSSNRQQATNNRLFHRNNGFTLIELIVVISLIGLMLFVSLPRLQHNPFLDDSNKSARWLIGKIQALKESAIRDQKQYALHIDLDSGRIWETNESMSQEDHENAALNSYALPEDVRIMDVEYPASEKITSGQTEITFYKAGYTDKAFIHMQEGETYLSFLIEPFLSDVQFIGKYAGFED